MTTMFVDAIEQAPDRNIGGPPVIPLAVRTNSRLHAFIHCFLQPSIHLCDGKHLWQAQRAELPHLQPGRDGVCLADCEWEEQLTGAVSG